MGRTGKLTGARERQRAGLFRREVRLSAAICLYSSDRVVVGDGGDDDVAFSKTFVLRCSVSCRLQRLARRGRRRLGPDPHAAADMTAESGVIRVHRARGCQRIGVWRVTGRAVRTGMARLASRHVADGAMRLHASPGPRQGLVSEGAPDARQLLGPDVATAGAVERTVNRADGPRIGAFGAGALRLGPELAGPREATM
jgi:hypothetical protein